MGRIYNIGGGQIVCRYLNISTENTGGWEEREKWVWVLTCVWKLDLGERDNNNNLFALVRGNYNKGEGKSGTLAISIYYIYVEGRQS